MEFERRLFCFVHNFDQKKQISYEYFVNNKEKVLKDIQDWLEVPYCKNLLEPMKKVVPHDLEKAISNYDEFREEIEKLLLPYGIYNKGDTHF